MIECLAFWPQIHPRGHRTAMPRITFCYWLRKSAGQLLGLSVFFLLSDTALLHVSTTAERAPQAFRRDSGCVAPQIDNTTMKILARARRVGVGRPTCEQILSASNTKRVADIIGGIDGWNFLFPIRHGSRQKPGAYPYTFENFLTAVTAWPEFCGDNVGPYYPTVTPGEACRRELATLFANINQETGAQLPPERAPFSTPIWRQGLYFFTEENCVNGAVHCAYSSCSGWPGEAYPCSDGKGYFGRGPLQLSWNYNYGPFSLALFGDVNVLLDDPDRVVDGSWLAFASAIWFFMTPRSPMPSPHDVIYGHFVPNLADISSGRLPGFGMVIRLINGIECAGGSSENQAKAANREEHYERFAEQFGVEPGPYRSCSAMAPFDESSAAFLRDAYWEKAGAGAGCACEAVGVVGGDSVFHHPSDLDRSYCRCVARQHSAAECAEGGAPAVLPPPFAVDHAQPACRLLLRNLTRELPAPAPPPPTGARGGAELVVTLTAEELAGEYLQCGAECSACVALPGNAAGVVDEQCGACSRPGTPWWQWPCNAADSLCGCPQAPAPALLAVGGETFLPHRVTAVSGPGAAMGERVGCSEPGGSGECRGAFVVGGFANVTRVSVVFDRGERAYQLRAGAVLDLMFEAVYGCREGAQAAGLVEGTLRVPLAGSVNGSVCPTGELTVTPCSLIFRARYSAAANTHLRTLRLTAALPPLNALGAPAEFVWAGAASQEVGGRLLFPAAIRLNEEGAFLAGSDPWPSGEGEGAGGGLFCCEYGAGFDGGGRTGFEAGCEQLPLSCEGRHEVQLCYNALMIGRRARSCAAFDAGLRAAVGRCFEEQRCCDGSFGASVALWDARYGACGFEFSDCTAPPLPPNTTSTHTPPPSNATPPQPTPPFVRTFSGISAEVRLTLTGVTEERFEELVPEFEQAVAAALADVNASDVEVVSAAHVPDTEPGRQLRRRLLIVGVDVLLRIWGLETDEEVALMAARVQGREAELIALLKEIGFNTLTKIDVACAAICAGDTQECGDGSVVERDKCNECEFQQCGAARPAQQVSWPLWPLLSCFGVIKLQLLWR